MAAAKPTGSEILSFDASWSRSRSSEKSPTISSLLQAIWNQGHTPNWGKTTWRSLTLSTPWRHGDGKLCGSYNDYVTCWRNWDLTSNPSIFHPLLIYFPTAFPAWSLSTTRKSRNQQSNQSWTRYHQTSTRSRITRTQSEIDLAVHTSLQISGNRHAIQGLIEQVNFCTLSFNLISLFSKKISGSRRKEF